MSYCLHNVSLYGKVTPPTMYLAQSHSFYETGQRSVLNSPQIYRIKHITVYMHFSGLILVLGIFRPPSVAFRNSDKLIRFCTEF